MVFGFYNVFRSSPVEKGPGQRMLDSQASRKIIAFCHIEKSAGTTIVELMRAHFGLHHVDVQRRAIVRKAGRVMGYLNDADDLRRDFRFYPAVRSIAGHHLSPSIDFEEFESRFAWYTFLREPVARLRSHYLHEVALRNRRESLPDYLRALVRDDIMVRKLAGGERDLEAAKRIVREKVRFVGFQESFDVSLVLLRSYLGIHGLRLSYGRARNTSTRRVGGARYRLHTLLSSQQARYGSRVQDEARAQLDLHHGLLVEANELDQQLYDWVQGEIWPRQVEAYGGVRRLKADTEVEMARPPLRSRKTAYSFLYRNLVYKPYIGLVQRRNRLLGISASTAAKLR